MSDSYVDNQARLSADVAEIIARNEAAGITTSASIWHAPTDTLLFEHGQDVAHEAASVNKLPIAWLMRENDVGLDEIVTWINQDVRTGYGRYDESPQEGEAQFRPMEASVRELLIDMLSNSGNTAPRALVNGALAGARNANYWLSLNPALLHTRLEELPDHQFFMGQTTSHEALHIARLLLDPRDREESEYDQVIREALSDTILVTDGVRSQLAFRHPELLASKIGILSGEEDDEGLARYHDVGGIWRSSGELTLCYAVLTSGETEEQARQSVKDIGRAMLLFVD